jgi:hypothetical protein
MPATLAASQVLAPGYDLDRVRDDAGVLPVLPIDFLHLALLIAIPGMALWLPQWLD